MIAIKELFERFSDEFCKFELVENKLHNRPDIVAFLLLDKLVPGIGKDIIIAAEHDEIYLDVDCEFLANAATEDDIKTLIRCGVRYDESNSLLCMFV